MKLSNLLVVGGLFAAGIYIGKHHDNPLLKQAKDLIKGGVFPLQPGDDSIFVGNVQKALINKGGEYAHLVLSAGGVTGYYNEQTAKAVEMAGFSKVLNEVDYRSLVNDKSIVRNLAYVIDVDGTPLYSSVSDSHIPDFGYGRDRIMTLPCKTHLGTATGNFRNGMIEIATTINTRKIKFWVPSSKINMLSQAEYDAMKSTRLLPKSDDAKMNLLKA